MIRLFVRRGAAALLMLGFVSCTPMEGERCNPQNFTDQCASGTMCIYPTNCSVAYCCPSQVTAQTSVSCQACAAPDGGTSH